MSSVCLLDKLSVLSAMIDACNERGFQSTDSLTLYMLNEKSNVSCASLIREELVKTLGSCPYTDLRQHIDTVMHLRKIWEHTIGINTRSLISLFFKMYDRLVLNIRREPLECKPCLQYLNKFPNTEHQLYCTCRTINKLVLLTHVSSEMDYFGRGYNIPTNFDLFYKRAKQLMRKRNRNESIDVSTLPDIPDPLADMIKKCLTFVSNTSLFTDKNDSVPHVIDLLEPLEIEEADQIKRLENLAEKTNVRLYKDYIDKKKLENEEITTYLLNELDNIHMPQQYAEDRIIDMINSLAPEIIISEHNGIEDCFNIYDQYCSGV